MNDDDIVDENGNPVPEPNQSRSEIFTTFLVKVAGWVSIVAFMIYVTRCAVS